MTSIGTSSGSFPIRISTADAATVNRLSAICGTRSTAVERMEGTFESRLFISPGSCLLMPANNFCIAEFAAFSSVGIWALTAFINPSMPPFWYAVCNSPRIAFAWGSRVLRIKSVIGRNSSPPKLLRLSLSVEIWPLIVWLCFSID